MPFREAVLIIEKRYTAKAWFRPWMLRAVLLPFVIARNLIELPRRVREDMDAQLSEWEFPERAR